MTIKLWNLINDKNDMPKLNIVNEIEYEEEGELIVPYETIPILCKLTKMHVSHTENVYMATYNHFHKLIGFFHIATGGMDKCTASNRIISTYLLLSGGFSFEIFHNHPVDDQTPSDGDINLIDNRKTLADYLEIEYIADYVITKGGWTNVNSGEMYRFTEEELEFINS